MTRKLYYHLRKYEGKSLVVCAQLCVEVTCGERELLSSVAARIWPVVKQWAIDKGGDPKYPTLVPSAKNQMSNELGIDSLKA